MRLRADLWVAAYIRTCNLADAWAVLRRRGAAEAGAIIVKLDRLDGSIALYGPAPQSELEDSSSERRFTRLHREMWLDAAKVDARLQQEIRFDPDLWIIEVEDRAGRSFLDLVD
jgi:hypothetical protein